MLNCKTGALTKEVLEIERKNERFRNDAVAEMEGCSTSAVVSSISAAIENIRKILSK